jgi:uncharacterized protein (TIGR02246 family)
VTDEEAIRALVARYADAVNDRDRDAYEATWCEDATWDLAGSHLDGRAAIVERWLAVMQGFATVVQLVHHGSIDVDGDTATARWSLSEHLVPVGGGDPMLLVGTYRDRYTREGDGWRFAHRDYSVLHSSVRGNST